MGGATRDCIIGVYKSKVPQLKFTMLYCFTMLIRYCLALIHR